jgi:hypothetical protein
MSDAAREERATPPSTKRISERERFRYIGFEVFPGKPKDLFRSEAERNNLVESVRAKREKGDVIREDCKLLEQRISFGERLVLTLACVVIIATLFLPWYSAYNETVISGGPAAEVTTPAEPVETEPAGEVLGGVDAGEGAAEPDQSGAAETEAALDEAATEETPLEEAPLAEAPPTEEVLTSAVMKRKVERTHETLSGLGSLAAIGGVGSYIFSSGFALIITGVLLILMTVSSIILPIFTLYTIWGLKGDPDTVALKLKRYLKLNWIPVILFFIALALSFLGAEYASGTVGTFTSIGDAYGPVVFLGTVSWGIMVSLAGFILLAAKGIEI